ncbi:hypothetical protein ACJX0J_025882, partial [Zea mays]
RAAIAVVQLPRRRTSLCSPDPEPCGWCSGFGDRKEKRFGPVSATYFPYSLTKPTEERKEHDRKSPVTALEVYPSKKT